MWKWKRRRPSPEEPVRGAGLGDECDAFLAGEWVEYLVMQGGPVASWAWLNRVAHAPRDVLRALAHPPARGRADLDEWSRLRAGVAETMLLRAEQDQADLAELQRSVLVPIELRLCGDEDLQHIDNGQLLTRVLAALNHPSARSH